MATFLGFLRNLATSDEFVAPVDAGLRSEAETLLRQQYPESYYRLHTVYEHKEMLTILENLKRWPGVASKVQPALDVLLGHVRGQMGGLPPLRKPAASTPMVADGGRIEAGEQDKGAERARLQELQEMAARLNIPGAQSLAAKLLAELEGIAAPAPQLQVAAPASARGVNPTAGLSELPKAPLSAAHATQAQGTSAVMMLKALRGR